MPVQKPAWLESSRPSRPVRTDADQAGGAADRGAAGRGVRGRATQDPPPARSEPVEDFLADEGGDVGTGGARLHVGGDGDDGLLGRADEAELAVAARHAVRVAVGLAPDAKAVAAVHAEALGVVRVLGGDALP